MLATSEKNSLLKQLLTPSLLCVFFLQILQTLYSAGYCNTIYTNEGDIPNSCVVTGVNSNPTVPDKLSSHLHPPFLCYCQSSQLFHLSALVSAWLSVCQLAQSVGLFLSWRDSVDCRIVVMCVCTETKQCDDVFWPCQENMESTKENSRS